MRNFTDWEVALPSISDKEFKNILELGCGMGTRILSRKFKYVYSFETARDSKWYDITKKDISDADNWSSYFQPFSYYGFDITEDEVKSSGGSVRNLTPLDSYYTHLNKFVNLDDIDVAFVDQGFHFRAETVLYFMEHGIDEIMIHDSSFGKTMYGWGLIDEGKYGYTSQEYLGGQGTKIYTRIDNES